MNKKIKIKTLLIILLFITISLILFISNIKNINIKKFETNKKQLSETSNANSYIAMQTHLSEVKEQEEKLLTFKSSIATAITNEGITTSSTDTAETMGNNISEILKIRTTLSNQEAATSSNISEGKKAWVNGELITGTGSNTQNVTVLSNSNSCTVASSYKKILFISDEMSSYNNLGFSFSGAPVKSTKHLLSQSLYSANIWSGTSNPVASTLRAYEIELNGSAGTIVATHQGLHLYSCSWILIA